MNPQLRAAAGRVELHPVKGAPLTGFGSRLEPSTGSHDPLHARMLLLDDGSTELVWISCDVIGFDPEDDARLRDLVAGRLSIPTGHVLVSCTHTHSGPASMPFRGPLAQVDHNWLNRTFEAIVGGAAALPPRLRPARVTHAVQTVEGLGYNRQDGTSPIDERLFVMRVSEDGADAKTIATILNYATHPVVLGERNLLFTADYPGYAAKLVEEALGGEALFVLGSAGDVDPVVYRDQGRGAGTFEIAEAMGRRLATAAAEATARAATSQPARGAADARLAVVQRRVELPLAPPPSPEELAAMKDTFLPHRAPPGTVPAAGEARWAMFQLAWIEQLERAMAAGTVPRTLPVQMVAARIGTVSVVTFPLEIYSQIGLDLREALAPRPVIIAGYTNGLFGYAPTDLALEQGGYGPGLSYRFFPHLLTPLTRGTAARLTRAAIDLVRSLEPE